ncbi:MAG: hypothetical protein M0T85_08830 [Dehalococcoidales bacterium]|nr:hypothetical protein [Dehalococcoidales bacterium]
MNFPRRITVLAMRDSNNLPSIGWRIASSLTYPNIGTRFVNGRLTRLTIDYGAIP